MHRTRVSLNYDTNWCERTILRSCDLFKASSGVSDVFVISIKLMVILLNVPGRHGVSTDYLLHRMSGASGTHSSIHKIRCYALKFVLATLNALRFVYKIYGAANEVLYKVNGHYWQFQQDLQSEKLAAKSLTKISCLLFPAIIQLKGLKERSHVLSPFVQTMKIKSSRSVSFSSDTKNHMAKIQFEKTLFETNNANSLPIAKYNPISFSMLVNEKIPPEEEKWTRKQPISSSRSSVFTFQVNTPSSSWSMCDILNDEQDLIHSLKSQQPTCVNTPIKSTCARSLHSELNMHKLPDTPCARSLSKDLELQQPIRKCIPRKMKLASILNRPTDHARPTSMLDEPHCNEMSVETSSILCNPQFHHISTNSSQSCDSKIRSENDNTIVGPFHKCPNSPSTSQECTVHAPCENNLTSNNVFKSQIIDPADDNTNTAKRIQNAYALLKQHKLAFLTRQQNQSNL